VLLKVSECQEREELREEINKTRWKGKQKRK
jgi:hypothetical protein